MKSFETEKEIMSFFIEDYLQKKLCLECGMKYENMNLIIENSCNALIYIITDGMLKYIGDKESREKFCRSLKISIDKALATKEEIWPQQ